MSSTDPHESPTVAEEPQPLPETIQSEQNDSDTSEETLLDEDVPEDVPDVPEVPEEVPVVPVSPVKKVKRAYTRKAPKPSIPTSDENVTVILKTRKKGPRKKQVIVYKEDIPIDPIEIVEKVRRKPGRPRTKPVEVVKAGGQPEVIVFEKPAEVKITTKQLRAMELETRLLELQAVSGNQNLKLNRRGGVDGRQSKIRTPAQIATTARLVEANKLRRLKKADDAKQEVLGEQREIVSNIISALNQTKVAKVEADNQKAVKAKEADAKRKKMVAMFD